MGRRTWRQELFDIKWLADHREPQLFAEAAQVPRVRTAFERGLPNARLEVASSGDLMPDPFVGEIATIYVVRERGVVVSSSCSHPGIINTIRHVQQITGLRRIHAVVGGWHLADAPDDVLTATVDALVELDPDYVVPMHCTGFVAMARLEQALPGRLIEPSAGTRVTFGT